MIALLIKAIRDALREIESRCLEAPDTLLANAAASLESDDAVLICHTTIALGDFMYQHNTPYFREFAGRAAQEELNSLELAGQDITFKPPPVAVKRLPARPGPAFDTSVRGDGDLGNYGIRSR